MTYRTILVQLGDDAAAEARMIVSRRLADRFDAAVMGLSVLPTTVIPAGLYGEASVYIGPQLVEAQREVNARISERTKAAFRRLCGTGPTTILREVEGDAAWELGKLSSNADLVVVGQNRVAELETWRVAERLVLAAGVPVLMQPVSVEMIGKTILIGWDGSRAACRATHDALPLLQGAERVVLCAVGADVSTDLAGAAAMLHRHGVAVEAMSVDEGAEGIGQTLLDQARSCHADLLVMGAYGHSRLREMVFGGATRHVLFEAEIPVLFGS